jgi:hypothetical protein
MCASLNISTKNLKKKKRKKKHYSRIRRHPLSKRLIKDRIFTAIIYKNLIGDRLEKSNLIF